MTVQCLSFLGRQSVFKEQYLVEFCTAQLPDVEKKGILKQHLQLAGRAMPDEMIDHCRGAFNSPLEKGAACFEQTYAFLMDKRLLLRIWNYSRV